MHCRTCSLFWTTPKVYSLPLAPRQVQSQLRPGLRDGPSVREWSYFGAACPERVIFHLRALHKQYSVRVNPVTYSEEPNSFDYRAKSRKWKRIRARLLLTLVARTRRELVSLSTSLNVSEARPLVTVGQSISWIWLIQLATLPLLWR